MSNIRDILENVNNNNNRIVAERVCYLKGFIKGLRNGSLYTKYA